MKFTHAIAVTFLMSFFAFSAQSGDYRAPKLNWNKSKSLPKVEVAKEKDFKEFSETSYRVHEDPANIRDVASEKEPVESDEGRGPSSAAAPQPIEPMPQPWPYK